MAAGGRGVQDPAKLLGAGPLPAVMLLCGPEVLLVERAVAILRSRLGVDDDARLGRTVWGDDSAERIDDALGDLANPGLFGGVRLVVLRRAEALKGRMEDRVAAFLETPPAGHLALVAAALDRRRKLFQRIPKNAVHEFGAVNDRHELLAWIGALARERGVRVSSDAASELVERCGGGLSRLASELDKLAGEGSTVGLEEVRRLVAATRSHGVDELAAYVAAGDRAGAIGRLRALLAEGEPVPRMVAFLAGSLRRTLHVAELREMGLGEAAIASRLKMPSWLVRKQSRRASARSLEEALASLSRLDRSLKTSRTPDAAVEAAIVTLTTPR